MSTQNKHISNNEEETTHLLNFQLDMLKTEIGHIQEIIARIDKSTQEVKNWAIIIWAGSISILISNANNDFKKIIFLTAIVPFLFWFVDAQYRRRQRTFIFRNKKISDYINSEDFASSFKQKKLVNFTLLDLAGKQYDFAEMEKFSTAGKAMWFKSVRTFYLGIIIVTVFLQLILYPYNFKNQDMALTTSIQKDSIKIVQQQSLIDSLQKTIKLQDSVFKK